MPAQSTGHWYCVSHAEALGNNLMAGHHYDQGCELGWYCWEHDQLETPDPEAHDRLEAGV